MTGPDLRVHVLSGDVEHIPSREPSRATTHAGPPSPQEQTVPIRPITPALRVWLAVYLPLRTRWRNTNAKLPIACLTVAAGVAILTLTTVDDPTDPTPASEPTVTVSRTPGTGSPMVPVGIPAIEEPTAVCPLAVTPHELDSLPEASLDTHLIDTPVDPDPTGTFTGATLHPTRPTPIYREPGGQPIARLPPTMLGAPTWVPIISGQPGWAMILLPAQVPTGEPNPAGWVHLTTTLHLAHLDRHLRVDGQTGTLSVAAILGTPDPTGTHSAGHRSFMAVSPAARPAFWLTAIWWPVMVRAERLCPSLSGGIVIPGLGTASLLGKLDDAGCLTTPPALWPLLRDLPPGTPVVMR